MKHSQSHFLLKQSKKTHQDYQEPDNFQFYFVKNNLSQNDHLSPTSTCPSEAKSSQQQSQADQKPTQIDQPYENQTTIQFGCFQGNILGLLLSKFQQAVSNYLKKVLNSYSEKVQEFVSVKEFQGMDLQKQQFPNILTKYYLSGKSTKIHHDILTSQNSILRSFLEQITYLNYEQINMELIWIICEIYQFRSSGINKAHKIKEFLQNTLQSQKVQFINFRFIKEKIANFSKQIFYMNFLDKIFQIISELYMHYKIFQHQQEDQPNQPDCIRNEIKLFSSKRDIYDSEQQEEFTRLGCPNKKIKQGGEYE